MTTSDRLRNIAKEDYCLFLEQAADELDSLTKELADLRATAQRRLELLKRLEWCAPMAGINHDGRCAMCYGFGHHGPDCPLAAALKGETK